MMTILHSSDISRKKKGGFTSRLPEGVSINFFLRTSFNGTPGGKSRNSRPSASPASFTEGKGNLIVSSLP
jgi:hypothetical protein